VILNVELLCVDAQDILQHVKTRGRRHPMYQTLVDANGDVYVDNVVWAVLIGVDVHVL
jgi:hypothetical protein